MELDDADRPWKLLSFTLDLVIVGVDSHCAGVIVVLTTSLHRALGTVDIVGFVVAGDELEFLRCSGDPQTMVPRSAPPIRAASKSCCLRRS